MRRAHGIATIPVLGITAAVGLAVGVSGYAFIYAQGASYLTNDPAACANCHVMQGHYDAWRQSTHHFAAVCNDCHTPASPIAKYLVKAENGFHHSMAFTLGGYPDNIRARPASLKVVNDQCKRCHAQVAQNMSGPAADGDALDCIRCHASVGHLR